VSPKVYKEPLGISEAGFLHAGCPSDQHCQSTAGVKLFAVNTRVTDILADIHRVS